MQNKKIPLVDTKSFSNFFLDYIQRKEALQSFYHRFPSPENFEAQIAEKKKSFPAQHREVLVSALRRQYKRLTPDGAVAANISALAQPKTFTVTTGHQLNIFTGPLYFILKIITVINACKELSARYPGFSFVPVYWMASEDHDYDEIKYFRLYGKKYTWETSQRGAVGRFNTRGIENVLKDLPGDVSLFRDAYTKNSTLADAVRHYVHELFQEHGLVVIDADDRDLKTLFAPVMEADILRGTTVGLVDKTNESLEKLGYKAQVLCRDVNFFYLDTEIRERIEKRDDRYFVLDTDLSFSADELQSLIRSNPERFSPNVILRPLYQEWILPDLAYVGGPAENVYWLQLRNVFDHFSIPFPMLMPRNFAMVVDHTVMRKLDKTGLELPLYFEDKHVLFNQWTLRHSGKDLSVDREKEAVGALYNSLKQRVEEIDKTLGPLAEAEQARVLRGLEKIGKKLLRAEKRNHDDRLRQIEWVKDALFPGGGLQERVDNFLNFYQQDKEFIAKLIAHLDPFDYQFNVLTYNGA